MVNKLGPDGAGDARSCSGCRRTFWHISGCRCFPSFRPDAENRPTRERGREGGRGAEEQYQNSWFLYQPCVFLWWKVRRSWDENASNSGEKTRKSASFLGLVWASVLSATRLTKGRSTPARPKAITSVAIAHS